ncbi:MAG: hypothetical protein K2O70_07840, partial [Desulfovibrionaceae bacterium]|nr:hypothetical protein [Desulfovibrionaceae bacterium]
MQRAVPPSGFLSHQRRHLPHQTLFLTANALVPAKPRAGVFHHGLRFRRSIDLPRFQSVGRVRPFAHDVRYGADVFRLQAGLQQGYLQRRTAKLKCIRPGYGPLRTGAL